LHYETLIRDTTALKEFITLKFKANRISGRIADLKSFSYKRFYRVKILEELKDNVIKKQLPTLKTMVKYLTADGYL
jgi:hypothetical protein